MNVLDLSKPTAMMSLAFSTANLRHCSRVRSFHRNFSSSVSWMTIGTLNASCRYLERTAHHAQTQPRLKTG